MFILTEKISGIDLSHTVIREVCLPPEKNILSSKNGDIGSCVLKRDGYVFK